MYILVVVVSKSPIEEKDTANADATTSAAVQLICGMAKFIKRVKQYIQQTYLIGFDFLVFGFWGFNVYWFVMLYKVHTKLLRATRG